MTRRQSPKVVGRIHDFSMRLSSDEHEKLAANAAVSGVTMSSFMRSMMLDYLSSNRRPDGLVSALSGLSRELAAVGNNLNQIAHLMNATGTSDASDVTRSREDIDTLKANIRAVMHDIRA